MTEQLKLCEKAKCITALRDILIIWKTIQVATSATWPLYQNIMLNAESQYWHDEKI